MLVAEVVVEFIGVSIEELDEFIGVSLGVVILLLVGLKLELYNLRTELLGLGFTLIPNCSPTFLIVADILSLSSLI